MKVHDGFQQTQNRTSDVVLSTVKSALSSTGFTRVLTTGAWKFALPSWSSIILTSECTPITVLIFAGHSLGAAIATLDALMLKLNLPSNVEVDSVVFGLPRVGDQDFANLIDSTVGYSSLFHIRIPTDFPLMSKP